MSQGERCKGSTAKAGRLKGLYWVAFRFWMDFTQNIPCWSKDSGPCLCLCVLFWHLMARKVCEVDWIVQCLMKSHLQWASTSFQHWTSCFRFVAGRALVIGHAVAAVACLSHPFAAGHAHSISASCGSRIPWQGWCFAYLHWCGDGSWFWWLGSLSSHQFLYVFVDFGALGEDMSSPFVRLQQRSGDLSRAQCWSMASVESDAKGLQRNVEPTMVRWRPQAGAFVVQGSGTDGEYFLQGWLQAK